jgi:plasmid stabilization system protein ParE
MRVRLERFDFTASFRGELAAAPEDVRIALKDVLRRARENPEAGALRFHSLKGYGKPTLYKFDVFPNKSWQVSFELDGTTAVLIRVCTHKEMDRRPR